MAKLTHAEIATIKELLDTQGGLPRSFKQRLFPDEQSETQPEATSVQHITDYLTDALAQASHEENDQVDVAALAQGNEIHIWRVPRLWALAQMLPVDYLPVKNLLVHFDTARWLGADEPATVRAIVEHARRILATDLTYPIILSAEGRILDGMHRIAKAWITDIEMIAAVRFRENPPPDFCIPST
jgi:hypothetical protein